MNKDNFIVLMVLLSMSCTKGPVNTPSTKEIDFTSSFSNYFTPAQIKTYKLRVNCGETAYWEGKPIKLQGFCLQSDTIQKFFFLYEARTPDTETIAVYYNSKDSVVMAKKLRENRDKHCLVQATCLSEEGITIGCNKVVRFTLAKPEDLEFK